MKPFSHKMMCPSSESDFYMRYDELCFKQIINSLSLSLSLFLCPGQAHCRAFIHIAHIHLVSHAFSFSRSKDVWCGCKLCLLYCRSEKKKPLPKLVYNLLSDKDIRKRLKELGLNTQGDRQVRSNGPRGDKRQVDPKTQGVGGKACFNPRRCATWLISGR